MRVPLVFAFRALLFSFCVGFLPTAAAQQIPAFPDTSAIQWETLPSGLRISWLAEGDGEPAKTGQRAQVHYAGWLTNGTLFDNSIEEGKPFKVKVNVGEVIPGWDAALQRLPAGAKAYLIVPPGMGYGTKGYPGLIPANAWLVFYLEVLSIK